jgi:hypothetical protein
MARRSSVPCMFVSRRRRRRRLRLPAYGCTYCSPFMRSSSIWRWYSMLLGSFFSGDAGLKCALVSRLLRMLVDIASVYLFVYDMRRGKVLQ